MEQNQEQITSLSQSTQSSTPLIHFLQYLNRPERQKTLVFKQQIRNFLQQYSENDMSNNDFKYLFKGINQNQFVVKFKVKKIKFYTKFFQYIKQINSSQVFLIQTQYCHVLKMIISLPLTNNDIRNIQNISFLNLPNVEQFDLEQNQITIMKAIKKTNWKNLKMINFDDNPFMVLELDRIKMKYDENNLSKYVNCLTIWHDQLIHHDLALYSKWQIPKQGIRLSSFDFSYKIPQPKIAKTLDIEYQNL